jgi:peptide/nickel transport system ATP-binding protein
VFHPRCPKATEACKGGIPPLVDVGPNHSAACIHV